MRAARMATVMFVLGCQSVGLVGNQWHRTASSAPVVLEVGQPFRHVRSEMVRFWASAAEGWLRPRSPRRSGVGVERIPPPQMLKYQGAATMR